MAGAPVPVWMHEAFSEILSDGAELHTPYGATESLPVASIGSLEVLGSTQGQTREGGGICVGQPAPGIDLSIIRISDEPITEWSDSLVLPTGEIGEICVRGEVVTTEYKNAPGHTAAAKILREKDVCHRMGDVGYLDESGRLWFCGRKAHRVTLENGDEMYTVPCEAIFNEHPEIYRSALVGVDGVPVIVVEREPGSSTSEAELTRQLLVLGQANPLTASIERVRFHSGFPVDVRHNAKIHRGELAEWAAR
jgi:acyl-CoA synthetase (AMP-forming)/AMP-acid ligase II